MSLSAFEDILKRARRELTPNEQLKLVDELSRHPTAQGVARRIIELDGLGKELWAGINPDEYVREERDSWDG
jgi:hypothetical protein